MPFAVTRRPKEVPEFLASRSTTENASSSRRTSRGSNDTNDDNDLDHDSDALLDWLLENEDVLDRRNEIKSAFQEEEEEQEEHDGDEDLGVGEDDDAEEVVEEDLSLREVAALIQDQVPVGMLDNDQFELLRLVLRCGATTSFLGSDAEATAYALDGGETANDHEASGVADGLLEEDLQNGICVVNPVALETLLYRLVDEFKARHKTLGSPTDDNNPEIPVLSDDDFLVAVQAWKDVLLPGKGRLPDQPAIQEHGRSPVVQHHHHHDPSDVMKRVLRLYKTQLDVFESCQEPGYLRPTPGLVEAVLSVVAANVRERGMDRLAWDVVQAYRETMTMGSEQETPTPLMYRYLIEVTARTRGGADRSSASRAEKILREAVKLHPPRRDSHGNALGMTIDSFNVILTAWAKSGLEYGPERAEKLLVWMEELESRSENLGTLRPTVVSFTSLVDAYAQVNDWDGASKAEQILNRMLELHLNQKEAGGDDDQYDVEPNIATWTIVMSAWARLSKKHYKNAASRAYQLLRRMESLHADGRISFPPDAIAYVTCMNALAFSKSAEGPDKAREILNEMNERYLDGDDSMKPSPKSIRILIGSFVNLNSVGGMKVAEQVLDQYEPFLDEIEDPDEAMEQLRDAYRTMLFGYCKADDPKSAQSYLLEMVERDMRPDCLCWDKVIEAYAKQMDDGRSLRRAVNVWELMKEEEARGHIKPNERLYTSYIRALAKGKADNLATQSMSLLEEMRDGYRAGNKGLNPTVFTCNALLLACSEDSGSPVDAFKVAVQIFNDVRTMKDGPDQVTFGNMLRCANLLPDNDRRDTLIRSTFQLCCNRGFVNSFVIRDLQAVAPEPLWRSLLQCPDGDVDMERIPTAWTSKFATSKRRRL
jgi:pentatricopeptide repeat protein